MADTSAHSNNNQKVRQGHKLVWLTLIIIAIPCVLIGYVLLTSMEEQNSPVTGNRFSDTDISPSITNTAITNLDASLQSIPNVESATVNLKSATLRIHLNMVDTASEQDMRDAIEQAYSIVNSTLPVETYFTNTDDGKMYDLEIDAYNYLVDDSHPASEQIIVQMTKTGASGKVVDVLTTPKDPQLVSEIKRETTQTIQDDSDQQESEDSGDYYYEDEETGW